MAAENPIHEDDRKLFVGGLPQEAKDTDIQEYFGTFGETENINLKTDPNTGRSRGFAFILFKDVEGLTAATGQEAHVVKGKKITCKKAEAKQGKIYLGNLPPEGISNEDIETHFATFGSVAEVVRPVDKSKNNEPKNFAFVTFDREETAKQLVKEGSTTINGIALTIKKVTPKDGGGWGGRGGKGGGGYGAGGWGYGGYGAYGMDYGGYGGYDAYGGYAAGPMGYGGYGGMGGGAGGPGAGGKMRGGGGGRSRPY